MRILLVDDEPIVLQGINTIIQKTECKDWAVVGQCTSGEEALTLFDTLRPDIIITDIRMNGGISGLELTQQIKKKDSDTLIILLTGYAYFDFARQAIKLGAFDYLLKPTCYSHIIDCLQRAQRELQQKREKQMAENLLNDNLENHRTRAREKFLIDLTKGLYPVDQDVDELCRSYNLQADSYLVLFIKYLQQCNALENDSKDKNIQIFAIKNFIAEFLSEDCRAVPVTIDSEHLFVVLLVSVDHDLDTLSRKIDSLSITASQVLNLRMWIGVSSPCSKAEELCVCYEQAEHCLTLANNTRSGLTFFSHLPLTNPEIVYSDNIIKALVYIQNHYQESLSLKAVADHVYLNIWYFSDLFKREVGKSFTDYVTELRINHAKELLKDRNKKLYQIAYEVGINEPAYFSQLFKKVTGQSPKEYRNSLSDSFVKK